ncbi:hypothetical protein RvY_08051 [Ramazzottius varieornatus]|uniref:Uncharacterized protein n=1 Tax=Ramazzottius varieornatus TaxID=947166 RepID=A0A1D1V4F1_RAMVA|nr:hypothetical protein RvY_08051 [Ramazzottius varieornatus]
MGGVFGADRFPRQIGRPAEMKRYADVQRNYNEHWQEEEDESTELDQNDHRTCKRPETQLN